MLRFKENKNGFTILEVVIAITVLIIGILSLAKIFPLAVKVSLLAEQTTIAAGLAQAEIEQMFYLDYDNISTGTIEAKHRLASTTDNPFYNYQRQTSAQYVDVNFKATTTDTGLKKVTVTVYWNSAIFNQEKNKPFYIVIGKK